jgi:hypothetical protein
MLCDLLLRWKEASENQNSGMMATIIDDLHVHTSRYLESLGIDRTSLEMEGLGLRTLTSTDGVTKSAKSVLARRFYRLAQWTEIKQGPYWLSVSKAILTYAEAIGSGLGGIQVLFPFLEA